MNKECVLIADDEARIRSLLRTVLSGEGYDILEAADGDQALSAIRGRRPAAVVLDVLMPGCSGLDVCRQVRADPGLDDVGVLIVSANATEAEARAAGADAFLAKPFSPRALSETVRSLAAGGATDG